jgi:Cytochrome c554 and c-prime
MGHTASHVADSQVLASHARLILQDGRYTFQIITAAGKSVYTINDGANSVSKPLVWAFGDGHIGQSYLFEHHGTLYESRVSYFDKLGALDFTPGRKLTEQKDLESAMARPVTDAELVRCFGCHTTASNINEKFAGEKAIPGITCEACHGPGLQHAVAQGVENLPPQLAGNEPRADLIFDPGKLAPADAVDFCGACHGTWWDVKLAALTGLANLRAQPYRLEKSRCWGRTGDARLTCVACHDPHRPLVHDLASYDKNCLSCHATGSAAKPAPDHLGFACKAATKNCVSCHMPKYEEPSLHYAFRDHFIRVVQPDAPYPD